MAVNYLKKTVPAAEIKLNSARAGRGELERKAERLRGEFAGYAMICRILGLADAPEFL